MRHTFFFAGIIAAISAITARAAPMLTLSFLDSSNSSSVSMSPGGTGRTHW
jgi:hypothetical protein